jgi:hypothetical protein
VDLTPTFVRIAEQHCAAREKHKEALRSAEGEHEFESQNRYRATAAQLARRLQLAALRMRRGKTRTLGDKTLPA